MLRRKRSDALGPSRLFGEPELQISIASVSVATGTDMASAGSVTVTCGTVATDDIIVVISGYTNGQNGSLQTPTASGLTFTQIVNSPANGDWLIGVWWAKSPDSTSRAIRASHSATAGAVNYQACLVFRGVHGTTPSDGADASTTTFTETAAPTITGYTPGNVGSLSVTAFVASNYNSYTSDPYCDETNGWAALTGFRRNLWGGMAVATKEYTGTAPGTATFSQPSATGTKVSFTLRKAV